MKIISAQRFRWLFSRLGVSFISFIVTLLVLELGIRLYFSINPSYRPRLREEVIPAGMMITDKLLGWKTASNQHFSFKTIDAAKNAYTVRYSTTKEGFRLFPSTFNSEKKRILILGDSYTMAAGISDEDTYYYRLSKLLNADVFAYGTGGYGTLQEYMVLDEYFDRIKPDCVIIQFCSNDFINNDFKLELRSGNNNNRMRRPYLQTNGEIEYMIPHPYPKLRSFANNYSKLLLIILVRLETSLAEGPFIEKEFTETGKGHKGLQESKGITKDIFNLIKKRCHEVPLYVFTVDDYQPNQEVLEEVLEELNISFIPSVDATIREVESQGECVRAADGAHWNGKGHELAAEALSEYLRSHL